MKNLEVEEAYLKYFEPQTSKYYLGGLLVALDTKAFLQGFYAAKNNKNDQFDEDFLNIIKITQKLVDVKEKFKLKKNKNLIPKHIKTYFS